MKYRNSQGESYSFNRLIFHQGCSGTYLSQQGMASEGWGLEFLGLSGVDHRAGGEPPRWMRGGGIQRKMVDQRAGENGGADLDRLEKRGWAITYGRSFDPSPSDAPFNVLTETTWGTPWEVVCWFISVRGRGFTRLWRVVSLAASTLGWLKNTDGPLPQSVSVCAEPGGPAVWCQQQKQAFITQLAETPQKTIFCFREAIMVWLMMKNRAHTSVYSLFYEHLDSLAGSFVLCHVWDASL